LRLTLGAVAVVVGVLVLALSASAARNAGAASLTIRLESTVQSSRAVDLVPKHRLSRGDTASIGSILRNAVPQFGRAKGAVVGSDRAVFTVLSPPWSSVKVKVRLPGGTLLVQGRVRIGQLRAVVPVLGGTGRFANARGSCEVRSLLDRSINIYRLRIP